MQYALTFAEGFGDETFTGDTYVQDENSLIFYRTGNIIRQYFYPFPMKIVITPADEAEVPK
jgi:hypothetical protein